MLYFMQIFDNIMCLIFCITCLSYHCWCLLAKCEHFALCSTGKVGGEQVWYDRKYPMGQRFKLLQ
jgi:hypothetical protein